MKLGVAEPLRLVDVSRLPSDAIEETEQGCASAPPSATPTSPPTRSSASATRCSRRRCSPAPRASCATSPRSAATCSSARAAATSRTSRSPATSAVPGSGCPAREGEHRNHAILGHSEHCVATHPSDMAVALAAIDATVHVLGANGERTIPLPGLHRLPGDKPQHDTVLNPGDLITAVELGAPAPRSVYRKVRDRASFAFAVVLRRGRGRARRRRDPRGAGSRSAASPTCRGEPSARRRCCAARRATAESVRGARPTRSSRRRGRCGTTPSRCRWPATCSSARSRS